VRIAPEKKAFATDGAGSLQSVISIGGIDCHHLNPAVIDDILIVCHYSAK
jgi:hypothetical protein